MVVSCCRMQNYIIKVAASDDPSHGGYPKVFDFVGAPAGSSAESIDGTGTSIKLHDVTALALSSDDATLFVAEKVSLCLPGMLSQQGCHISHPPGITVLPLAVLPPLMLSL